MTTIEQDTDLIGVDCNGFENTGSCLQYRYNGRTQFRRLYTVTPETYKWDLGADFKVPEGYTLMATGSCKGMYCYILVMKVGKVPTQCPGGFDKGIRHRFLFVQELKERTTANPDIGYVVEDYWQRMTENKRQW